MIEKLRDEILESQKARTELMKWKLFLVAVIGAAGLGIGSKPEYVPVALLALIPFVCLYVDAICIHNEVRIMMIAQFLRTRAKGSIEREYEEHCKTHRQYFSLEGFSLVVTTVGLSILVLISGYYLAGLKDLLAIAPKLGDIVGTVLVCSGSIGMVAGMLFYCFYLYWIYRLDSQV